LIFDFDGRRHRTAVEDDDTDTDAVTVSCMWRTDGTCMCRGRIGINQRCQNPTCPSRLQTAPSSSIARSRLLAGIPYSFHTASAILWTIRPFPSMGESFILFRVVFLITNCNVTSCNCIATHGILTNVAWWLFGFLDIC
jgi:hypothetical protein